jgi:hypothetical protein
MALAVAALGANTSSPLILRKIESHPDPSKPSMDNNLISIIFPTFSLLTFTLADGRIYVEKEKTNLVRNFDKPSRVNAVQRDKNGGKEQSETSPVLSSCPIREEPMVRCTNMSGQDQQPGLSLLLGCSG